MHLPNSINTIVTVRASFGGERSEQRHPRAARVLSHTKRAVLEQFANNNQQYPF